MKGKIKVTNPEAENLEVGDTVWWTDQSGDMKTGRIYEIKEEKTSKGLVKVALIYENGKAGYCNGAELAICWPSKEKWLDAEAERSSRQTKAYEYTIRNTKELVRFMWNRMDKKDNDAAEAVIRRAKNLLGIDLEGRKK